MPDRTSGAVLIMVMVAILIISGLTGALVATNLTHSRASAESIDRESAYRAAESGVAYCLVQLALEPNFFVDEPAPQETFELGAATFQVERADAGSFEGQWNLVVLGTSNGSNYRMGAAIGYDKLEFPQGITTTGTGNPDDIVFRLNSGSGLLSYDSSVDAADPNMLGCAGSLSYDPSFGATDPDMPGDAAGINVDGSVDLGESVSVYGDVTTTGGVNYGWNSTVSGTVMEYSDVPPVPDFSSLASGIMHSSKDGNDNGVLQAIFGRNWTPTPGSENYGDLMVTGGTYVVPAGTYRFRNVLISGGATVTFDTSAGPTTIAFVGDGSSEGQNFRVIGERSPRGNIGSSLLIDPHGTSNGLTLVLGPQAGFKANASSVYGQTVGDPDSAGYSHIFGLDGSGMAIQVIGESEVYGRVGAPDHDLVLKGNSTWFGSAVVKSVAAGDVYGPAMFAVDEAVRGQSITDPANFQVNARWHPGY